MNKNQHVIDLVDQWIEISTETGLLRFRRSNIKSVFLPHNSQNNSCRITLELITDEGRYYIQTKTRKDIQEEFDRLTDT